MKTRRLFQITVAVLVTALSAGLSKCLGQGSLTPPGPPAATMLTLSQVEPRTPVDATHTPGVSDEDFIISKSGSYYLTTNIVATSGVTGIYIATNNVTLDLNGFSLLGASVGGFGIYIQSGCTNISVHDGIITGWYDGIPCSGADAVLDHLTISGSGDEGISFNGPGKCVLRNSIVSGNANGGIYINANNVTLEHLTVSSNNPGIYFYGVASGVIDDCTVTENATYGVEFVYSTNVTLHGLTISHNTGFGIYLYGSQNSTVSDCNANGNGNNPAIFLQGSSSFVLGNGCSGNGTGIYIDGANNQIDGNHVIGSNPSNTGIWIISSAGDTNNIVTRNFVTGYGLNDYSLGSGNIAGPIINSVASGIVTNSNPWANFGF